MAAENSTLHRIQLHLKHLLKVWTSLKDILHNMNIVVLYNLHVVIPQAGSPFREPLIKFLTRHPSQTVELFMMEATLNDPQWSRMFMVYLNFFSLHTSYYIVCFCLKMIS